MQAALHHRQRDKQLTDLVEILAVQPVCQVTGRYMLRDLYGMAQRVVPNCHFRDRKPFLAWSRPLAAELQI